MLVVFDVAAAEVPALGAAAPSVLHRVDAAEEVAGAGRAQVGERLADGHLDVLGRDLVGGRLRIDARDSRSIIRSRAPPGECQARPFGVEVGEQRHRGHSMLAMRTKRSLAVPENHGGAASVRAMTTSESTDLDAAAPEPPELDRDELIEDELIIEEISIDGMCGVY